LVTRNIIRNRKNSVIVLLLITVIVFLFFTGNSVIGRIIQSMEDAYINSITGDVVIEKSGDVTMNLFGANIAVIDDYFTIPVLPAHDLLVSLVSAESEVAGFTSQVSGRALLDVQGYRQPALICGVDVKSYFSLFPSIELVEGRFLEEGEYGAMISREKARSIESETGVYPEPGTMLLFTSGGTVGFKIREVPLLGIFRYKNAGQYMNELVIADPQTVRILSSNQVASSDVAISEEAAALIDADMDALFDAESAYIQEPGMPISLDELHAYLREMPGGNSGASSDGSWNFIILKLKKRPFSSPGTFIASLNKKLAPYGVTAVNWQTAAGESASIMLILQALFNSGIALVSITGVMVIINVLLIAVFRRRRELGTLRALGASNAQIRKLILGENLVLAGGAGLAGVLGGILFFRVVNGLDIPISNSLIASLLGSPVLRIEFFPRSAFVSFALAVILGLLSSLYPAETAVRIEPAAAMRDNGS
jgi:ABC-type lipoprotein release transport system permease subunit